MVIEQVTPILDAGRYPIKRPVGSLIDVGWFRTVATWNPISYLIEGLRSLIITGWDVTALARGLAVAAAVLVLSFWAANRALATRMERT